MMSKHGAEVTDTATKSQWIMRIGLLAIINAAYYLDNTITNYAVGFFGMSVERNPIARLFNVSPWLSLAGAFSITSLILIGYAKYKSENSQIFLDVLLVLIAFLGFLVIINGVITLLIGKTVGL